MCKLILLFLAPCFAALALQAGASTYPSRPVSIVVPVAAGGGADALVRMIATPLAERLGQPVVVENRPGGGGTIGFAQVAKARPDGHTLVVLLPPITYVNAMWDNLAFKTTDLAPVINMVSYPFVFAAHPAFPPNSLTELVDYARRNPGKVRFGSPGSSSQMLMLLLREKTGMTMLDVPYKGSGDARPAVLGGTVDFTLEVPAAPLSLVETGRLKVLGVGGRQRVALYPKAQALGELLPDLQMVSWIGLGAPAGTPRDIVERLHREVAAILRSPEMAQKLRAMHYDAVLDSPDAFAAQIRSEGEAFTRIIRQHKLAPN